MTSGLGSQAFFYEEKMMSQESLISTPKLQTPSSSRAALSLTPLLIFFTLFIGTGVYFTFQGVDYAFYQLPAPVAILPAIAIAIAISHERLEDAIETFIKGIGDSSIIAMCLIYLLAGAFASLTKSIGAVDAVVNGILNLVPSSLVLPGLFVIAAILSFSMGTSMGTLAALIPIGVALSETLQVPGALVAGILLSGAVFGDNLSVISDTSIAATRTQGATAKDKLKQNAYLAIPAALICLLLYSYWVSPGEQLEIKEYSLIKLIPYLLILVFAIKGWNVFLVLTIGIISAIIVGFADADFVGMEVSKVMYEGFTSMQEIFLLSFLVGGLGALMQKAGGLAWLVEKLVSWFGLRGSKKRTQMAILATCGVTNLAVANNTVSIILSGKVTKQLADESEISAKRSASLVDIGSCVIQGVLPYGAQCLLLGASFAISPVAPVQYAWYLPLLLFVTLASIAFPRFDFIRK